MLSRGGGFGSGGEVEDQSEEKEEVEGFRDTFFWLVGVHPIVEGLGVKEWRERVHHNMCVAVGLDGNGYEQYYWHGRQGNQ